MKTQRICLQQHMLNEIQNKQSVRFRGSVVFTTLQLVLTLVVLTAFLYSRAKDQAKKHKLHPWMSTAH